MKLAVQFESTTEFNQYINVGLVVGVCKHSFESFSLLTKLHLQENGIDENMYDTKYVPLVKKASKWYWQTGTPQNSSMTVEELLLWEELMKLCNRIITFQTQQRTKQVTIYAKK